MKKALIFLLLLESVGASAQWAVNGSDVSNTNTGNVGIGVATPSAKLHVVGSVFTDAENQGLIVDFNQKRIGFMKYAGREAGLWRTAGQDFEIGRTGGTSLDNSLPQHIDLYIDGNGNIGVSTLTPQAKLAVNGDIFSKKIKVTQTGWPDYVFSPQYRLPTLAEVEAFIKSYRHLPGVPSAAIVEKEGLDLGEGQVILLKKIEELTLHLIEINKRLEQQQALIDAQAKLLAQQTKLLEQTGR